MSTLPLSSESASQAVAKHERKLASETAERHLMFSALDPDPETLASYMEAVAGLLEVHREHLDFIAQSLADPRGKYPTLEAKFSPVDARQLPPVANQLAAAVRGLQGIVPRIRERK